MPRNLATHIPRTEPGRHSNRGRRGRLQATKLDTRTVCAAITGGHQRMTSRRAATCRCRFHRCTWRFQLWKALWSCPWRIHVGAALIGGTGTLSAEVEGEDTRFSALEIGGQLNVYFTGAFSGVHMGAEVLYVSIDSDEVAGEDVSGVGVGTAVGPLLGYKLLTKGGFTLILQAGVQYVSLKAQAEEQTTGVSQSDSESRFIPLLNFNVGWSL